MIEVIGVLIRQNKAYVPINAKLEGGGYLQTEPIYTADLTVEDLSEALKRAASKGNPRLPAMSKEDFQKRQDPMLEATGMKNWLALAKHSASYTIAWHNNQATLYISRLDKKGRFETDPSKTKIYPENVSLSIIAETILEDAKRRPELNE